MSKCPRQEQGKLESIKSVPLCLHLPVSTTDSIPCSLAPTFVYKAMLGSS